MVKDEKNIFVQKLMEVHINTLKKLTCVTCHFKNKIKQLKYLKKKKKVKKITFRRQTKIKIKIVVQAIPWLV